MIFKNKRFKAGTAFTLLAAFGWMTAGGNAWATNRAARRDPAAALARMANDPHLALSPEEKAEMRTAAALMAAQPRVEPREGQGRVPASHAGADPAAEMKQIALEANASGSPDRAERLKRRLEAAHKRALRRFDETDALLRKADLPKVIFERQRAARAEYMERAGAVFQSLEAVGKSGNPGEDRSALAAASELLAKSTDERPVQAFDPSRLPFRQAKSVERQPYVPKRKAEDAGKAAITEKLVAPTAADLEANEDAQITPEIRALAASLDNQPLKIYNWVRNNIDYIPTHGSVQGSQMTLDARQGNAYDVSSLLIALLRSAGVHAKYVTGTVEIPAGAVKNWVGGAETAKVAQQLLGQGGVPNIGLVSGTETTHIRIEHVWVEAFIDYVPSRGAVHRTGDTWVPMDAAFKLHSFTPRSEVYTENPIDPVLDPEGLITMDESLGKVTGFDTEAFQERLADWVTRSDDYMLNNGGAPADLTDLMGKQSIVQETKTTFPGSLPYQVLVRAAGVTTLPESLRHYVTLNGFGSDYDRAVGDPSYSVRISLPELNSRRLSLQFDPATQADADTLRAARDNGASSLPVYLVNVVPVIRLDGVERGRGAAVQMGSAHPVDVVLQAPDGPTTIAYRVVAGDEIVAGVTGNGVTRSVLEKRFAAHPVDNAPEYLHQVQLHYWMECDALGMAAAKANGAHMLRLPSVGFFSSPLSVSYYFGAPTSGVYQGRNMDVKQSLLGAAAETPAQVVGFMKLAGAQGSYLEGSVLDQLDDPSNPATRGISSIHLLNVAAEKGIPIYNITSANIAAVMPRLSLHPAVENDIANAVAQGKTVIAPERTLNLGAWSGVGYIVQEETGAGAYLISGGLAGGGLLECVRELVPSFETVAAIAAALALAAAIAAALASAPVTATAAAGIALILGLGSLMSSVNSGPTLVA